MKVLNLVTYNIDTSIPVGLMPEGIITDGTTLWVANSGENTVSEIEISTYIRKEHFVVLGPQNLILHNSNVYVSRTYYSDDWNTTYHGASKIEKEKILINDYGPGGACGGSVLVHQNHVYRSFNGGLARMNEELNLDAPIIGNYNQAQVYHIEKINGNFWFSITDWSDLNEIHVLDNKGYKLLEYKVGQNPGDFAFWIK